MSAKVTDHPRKAAQKTKRVNLALQGGGSHGAFTWGVLDALLADGRIEIAAISGTSAGAMNAVALADGFTSGGPEGAREKLHHLWLSVSEAARHSPVKRDPLDVMMGIWSLERSWGYQTMNMMTRLFSPYQFNPTDMNPLRDIVEACIDFECVRRCDSIRLFISATNVETGRVKVFDSRTMTVDMVMASACLPNMFKAVMIDNVPYWDGGYMGNPALFPFHTESDSADTIVIQINPVERKGAPRSAHDIQNRLNEISFNSSLLKELRAIDFVTRLLDDGKLDEAHYRRARIHIIANEAELNPLGASSKVNAEWAFLTHLRDLGRETATAWLDRHHGDLGERGTVDLRTMFQGIGPEHQG
ncbi:patatin-like phospholipase family protein [Yoonia sp.]|uniref:patatin-like phospholipase family protein n=1 Tax=Yoonia sp. TaxID=2212373 RepID=UPI0019EF1637|nr:patatin-like phospholipase family protein [Yoonia sp.]MBE0414775.1 patatin-like phospholipase family protein [Yoonia sp.]